MNGILNKFYLPGDTFMPEMHLQSGFTYSGSRPFTKKTKKESKNLNKQEIQDILIEMN